MAAVITGTRYNTIWNALIALMQAQMVPGGLLATLQDVRKSAQFSTDLVPAACVQWMGYDPKQEGGNVSILTHHYRIMLAANSAATSTRVANLDDAMQALLALVDDDNGNGLIPMLNARSNFGLGNLAMQTRVTGVENTWEVREGEGQIIWAYCQIDYDAVVRTATS